MRLKLASDSAHDFISSELISEWRPARLLRFTGRYTHTHTYGGGSAGPVGRTARGRPEPAAEITSAGEAPDPRNPPRHSVTHTGTLRDSHRDTRAPIPRDTPTLDTHTQPDTARTSKQHRNGPPPDGGERRGQGRVGATPGQWSDAVSSRLTGKSPARVAGVCWS